LQQEQQQRQQAKMCPKPWMLTLMLPPWRLQQLRLQWQQSLPVLMAWMWMRQQQLQQSQLVTTRRSWLRQWLPGQWQQQ
jgi:hypothetical protein